VSLVAIVADAAIRPRVPDDVPPAAAPYDVVLHALHVACGALGAGGTSRELHEGIFRAQARMWFMGART